MPNPHSNNLQNVIKIIKKLMLYNYNKKAVKINK